MANEKILAARLLKDKPEGMEGLRYVIEEIMIAQQQGLIKKKNYDEVGKFANIWIENYTQKLSKQDKDRELMRIITNQRYEVLEKLMRDSVLNNDIELDEKVEKVFDDMAQSQQANLDQFFQKVEENLKQLDDTISATKTQVKSFEDQASKKDHPIVRTNTDNVNITRL